MALTTTDLGRALPLLSRGKVRDIYELPENTLLFIATDRISAYDAIMENGVPNKGKLLTAITNFWFDFFAGKCRTHLVSTSLDSLPGPAAAYRDQLEGRSVIVRKLKVLPVEAIVRGYITGGAWREYEAKGTVHGIRVREGLKESEAFDTPLFTPSTKAEQGEHDQNIHPEQMVALVGERYAKRVEELAVSLYTQAQDYAASRGIIIADTKFEFGIDEDDEIVLVDEVLTPDSSRFWLADKYEVGRAQESYDKQYLRNWLTSNGLGGKNGVKMPDEVAQKTGEKYAEAYRLLTGKSWDA